MIATDLSPQQALAARLNGQILGPSSIATTRGTLTVSPTGVVLVGATRLQVDGRDALWSDSVEALVTAFEAVVSS